MKGFILSLCLALFSALTASAGIRQDSVSDPVPSPGISPDSIASLLDSGIYSLPDSVAIAILSAAASDPAVVADDILRQCVNYTLSALMRNRVGSPAASFCFIDRYGKTGSLDLLDSGGASILMIFFDPDCEHCREIISEIDSDPRLSCAISTGDLMVLAVYPDGDPEAFTAACHSLPAGWVVALDTSGIQENEIYDIPETPTLYLLDPDHRVILRGISDISSILPAISGDHL
ncbi:MAG: thioredoxin family protein [Muribaculaceae bacterium]|nr:thioredoxin family protein [Muribaculaceae bacterium]